MNLFVRHVTGLADFSGRENRQPFWLWILIVYAFQMVVGMLVMIPLMSAWFDAVVPMMQADPERLNAHPELFMQQMIPMMQNMMVFGSIMGLVFVALVAAAVTRRLHDGNRSGWWAVPVFALQVSAPLVMIKVLPSFFAAVAQAGRAPDPNDPAFRASMQAMSLLSLIQMIGLAAIVLLIVFLALPGTQGDNRYGEDPLVRR